MFELIAKNGSDKGEDLILGTYNRLEDAIIDYTKACKNIENEYTLRDKETGETL